MVLFEPKTGARPDVFPGGAEQDIGVSAVHGDAGGHTLRPRGRDGGRRVAAQAGQTRR